jgi:hypothetical protein
LIYYIQSAEGGPIKVGYSNDVPRRIRQLEAHYGKPIAILGTMWGGRAEEAEIHARFAHLRIGRTEQFRPAADLMAFIGRPLFVNQSDVELMTPATGRPVPMRFEEDAYELARQAAALFKESIVAYASRVIRERANADLDRAAGERIGSVKQEEPR